MPVEGWAFNCEDVPAEARAAPETGDLMKVAQDLGFGDGEREARAEESSGKRKAEANLVESEQATSKKRRVKAMLARAKWSSKGTTVDPRYRREISLKLKKRKKSSSSGETSSGSETSSKGIGDEHRLKAIAKRLPGYLARRSAKEALEALAGGARELSGLREISPPSGGESRRGSPSPSRNVDSGHPAEQGDVLQSLDVIAQRLKSLELLQQGAEGEVGRQLELIPAEVSSLATTSEARFARAEHHADQKLRKQLWEKSRPPYHPGGWKGLGKPRILGERPLGKRGAKRARAKETKGRSRKW